MLNFGYLDGEIMGNLYENPFTYLYHLHFP